MDDGRLIMTRTCTHPGCDGAPSALGLCRRHYRVRLVTQPIANPKPETVELILASLPALKSKILADTGLSDQTLQRYIKRMRADEQMHIGRFKTPKVKGEKFLPIYYAGKGKDAVLGELKRLNQTRRTRRRNYAERTRRSELLQEVKAHGWMAALMVA
jgi:hypothetical protein